MQNIPETKKSHLWRKIVWQTDPETHPLGPYHSAEVYCCEEANGFAVWYVRKLPRNTGLPEVENADYLLNYFPKTRRDDAIERTVLIANSDPDFDKVIRNLDQLAMTAQKV
jgi:hypothetical protein